MAARLLALSASGIRPGRRIRRPQLPSASSIWTAQMSVVAMFRSAAGPFWPTMAGLRRFTAAAPAAGIGRSRDVKAACWSSRMTNCLAARSFSSAEVSSSQEEVKENLVEPFSAPSDTVAEAEAEAEADEELREMISRKDMEIRVLQAELQARMEGRKEGRVVVEEESVEEKEGISGEGGEEQSAGEGGSGSSHPWAQWRAFVDRLEKSKCFNLPNMRAPEGVSMYDDPHAVKRATLEFGRVRDDVYRYLSVKHLRIIAEFGCASIDRKVVNAAKRLREKLKIAENPVCEKCDVRMSCARAYAAASEQMDAGTSEVVRLLLQFAVNETYPVEERRKVPEEVREAVFHVLEQVTELSASPRDPNLPKPEVRSLLSVSSIFGDESSKRLRAERARKAAGDEGEMKPGDWRCHGCNYVNFNRNRTCRECGKGRPPRELMAGDWLCPQCNFANFARNRQCFDCQADRPYGIGFDRTDTRRPFAKDRVRSFESHESVRSFGDSRSSSWSRDEDQVQDRRPKFDEWKPDFKSGKRKLEEEEEEEEEDEDDEDDDDPETLAKSFPGMEDDDDDFSDVSDVDEDDDEDDFPEVTLPKGKEGQPRYPGSRGRGRGRGGGRSWGEDDAPPPARRSFRGEDDSERPWMRREGEDDGGSRFSRGRGGGRGGRSAPRRWGDGDGDREQDWDRDRERPSFRRGGRGGGRGMSSWRREGGGGNSDDDAGSSFSRGGRGGERGRGGGFRGGGGGRGGGFRGGGGGRGGGFRGGRGGRGGRGRGRG